MATSGCEFAISPNDTQSVIVSLSVSSDVYGLSRKVQSHQIVHHLALHVPMHVVHQTSRTAIEDFQKRNVFLNLQTEMSIKNSSIIVKALYVIRGSSWPKSYNQEQHQSSNGTSAITLNSYLYSYLKCLLYQLSQCLKRNN